MKIHPEVIEQKKQQLAQQQQHVPPEQRKSLEVPTVCTTVTLYNL
jgi:hypothetical protein